jgi:hypothetical protein
MSARSAARTLSREALERAVTVILRGEARRSVADAMAALPDPATLPEGKLVVIPSTNERSSSLGNALRSLFRGGDMNAPTALRCTALVARGYVDVGATDDGAIAWGVAPRASAESASSA